jgi:hypothetical protein
MKIVASTLTAPPPLRAFGRLSVTIRHRLNYAIHARGDNSRIHPGSLLTPIDRFDSSLLISAQMDCMTRKVGSGVHWMRPDRSEKAINQFVLLLDR